MKDNLEELYDKFDFVPNRGVEGMYFCKRCGKPCISRSYQCLTTFRWITERVRCHLGCGQIWVLKKTVDNEKVTVQ